MSPEELKAQLKRSACQVVGWEEAAHDEHRRVLGALAFAFDDRLAVVLCEPSVVRCATRPPDVVLIHPRLGVHVIELKAVTIGQVEGVAAGGVLRLRYRNEIVEKSPFGQVLKAMFDIKETTAATLGRVPRVPFQHWVIFSQIQRRAWLGRWGEGAWMPDHLLFAEDLRLEELASQLTAVGEQAVLAQGVDRCPMEDLAAVYRAFGDTGVLYPAAGEREEREVRRGTLGERFDQAAEGYRELSVEQRRLSRAGAGGKGTGGPRLVRGVAGSGKTIVLANQVARRLGGAQRQASLLEPDPPLPRLAVVCNNRTLVPLIRAKIDAAFRQRTGKPLPEGAVTVKHLYGLLFDLAGLGLWRKQRFVKGRDDGMFEAYGRELKAMREANPELVEALSFDAIFVDEGQDLGDAEYRLLAALCRRQGEGEGEAELHVFYDDAQNLFGRTRPNWSQLGLNMVGRSNIMTQCFRNPRQIVEPAFNVLYGSFADDTKNVPTRAFGDVTTLEDKGLIQREGGDEGYWRVLFTTRDAELPPRVTLANGRAAEERAIVERVRWLVVEERVRPEDVLVLAVRKERVEELAKAIERAAIPGIAAVHRPKRDRDLPLCPRDCVSVSTVASAKGYDAYCVLLASVNENRADVKGRASFYVGCTRAREYLEVLAYHPSPLFTEMQRAVDQTLHSQTRSASA